MTAVNIHEDAPWLEDWEVRYVDDELERVEGIYVKGGGVETRVETDSGIYPPKKPAALLIAEGPALARELLSLEWIGGALGDENWGPLCPSCRADGPVHIDRHDTRVRHEIDCSLDARLTAIGLDTQEKRHAAREAVKARAR